MGPIETVKAIAWPDVNFGEFKGPVVVADGQAQPVSELDGPLEAQAAHILGVNDRWFGRLCEHLRARSVHFYEMRVADLESITQLDGLEHLAIRWNTKLIDLTPLSRLGSLRTLVLEDTPKVIDLSPLAALKELRAVEYSGGIWNKNRARSLAPLAELPHLEELQLLNLAVESDGLRPLDGCGALRRFSVSNQFETADYAYLSVRLPLVESDMLAPYLRLEHPIEDKDVMVIGKRKPFLNSDRDADKLKRYDERFRELQEEFASG